jgi:hypothetical protein
VTETSAVAQVRIEGASPLAAELSEAVTAWIAAHPVIAPVEMTVVQSSDAAFHCVTIVVGYWEARPARPTR